MQKRKIKRALETVEKSGTPPRYSMWVVRTLRQYPHFLFCDKSAAPVVVPLLGQCIALTSYRATTAVRTVNLLNH